VKGDIKRAMGERENRREQSEARGRAGALRVRAATVADAPEVARLLHDFNTEFSSPTPGVGALADRLRELLDTGEVTVLLGGESPEGLAVLRFRPSLWSHALDAHLEELYVAPERRGHGLGRALLERAMDVARDAGAARMDVGTSVDDTAAIGLYESSGFTNREGEPDGPAMLFYERDL
jgi:ribosomal protein S18 acetylase RimI-like enzyme